jgi:diacylglycerol kinase (ATP)
MEAMTHEPEEPEVEQGDPPGDRAGAQEDAQGSPGAGIGGGSGHGSQGRTPGSAVRLALVANRRSGADEAADRVADLLRAAGADVQDVPLESFCDGPEGPVRPIELPGIDRVVVAGGDGSIGPAAQLALEARLPLAVIPAGTANSFARWLGLPLDVEEAARLAATNGPSLRPMEVAHLAGRPYVNVASTGLSVLAARHAHSLKPRLGPLAYAVGAVRAAVAGKPVRCSVRIDGDQAWSGAAWQVLVAATGAFGGESGTGGVDPSDAQLDVAVVQAGTRLALIRRALAMRRQELVHDDAVLHVRGHEIELDTPAGTPFNVDGEVLRPQRARFGVLGVIDVVAP